MMLMILLRGHSVALASSFPPVDRSLHVTGVQQYYLKHFADTTGGAHTCQANSIVCLMIVKHSRLCLLSHL